MRLLTNKKKNVTKADATEHIVFILHCPQCYEAKYTDIFFLSFALCMTAKDGSCFLNEYVFEPD